VFDDMAAANDASSSNITDIQQLGEQPQQSAMATAIAVASLMAGAACVRSLIIP